MDQTVLTRDQVTAMVNAANTSGKYDITIHGEYPIVAMSSSEADSRLIIQLQEGCSPSGRLDMQGGTFFSECRFYIPEGGKLLLDRRPVRTIPMDSPLSSCRLI